MRVFLRGGVLRGFGRRGVLNLHVHLKGNIKS